MSRIGRFRFPRATSFTLSAAGVGIALAMSIAAPRGVACLVADEPAQQTPAAEAAALQKEAAAPPTRFECRWWEGPLTLDGKADEPAWQHAELISSFYLPWLAPDKRRAPRTATKARLAWDREYLYFFAEMEDRDLYADHTEHDAMIWENDVFELFFKPAVDKPGYYEFQVNPAGAALDMLIPRRGAGVYRRFAKDGDFHLEAKVALRGTLNQWTDQDEGWSVEGRLPWKDFLRTGGRPAPGETWKFALCRYDYAVDFEGPDLSTCAPLAGKPHPDFHAHEDYADLRFVGPRESPRLGLAPPVGRDKYLPLTTSRARGSPDPPAPYVARREWPKLGLTFPIVAANEPGSRRMLFVDQQRSYGASRLCRAGDDPAAGAYDTLLQFDGVAYSLEFHPKFAVNGYLYVGWNGPLSGGPKRTKITRYTLGRQPPFTLDPASALEIISWESDGHNGAALAFGAEGMLYVTSGDGTSDSDTNVTGQRLDNLLAKVLRIDVDGAPEGRTYSVPKDNPFVDTPSARPETWAYGLRNPWRMTRDPLTGQLWVGNNGQDRHEQVYLVRKGDNYGWSVYEGSHPFYLERKLGPTPVTKPACEHSHAESRSLTGGVVYHGAKLPELKGAYLYGDYSTGKIWAARHDGAKVTWNAEIADTTLQISAFALDADGELLVLDHRGDDQGGFYRLEPRRPDEARPAFPRKLSETGLFRSVAGHVVEPALIPYSVNAQLWSDGAHKERFMALPGDNPQIEITNGRGWKFPDDTVLVKSFALDTREGEPASRRYVETRLLLKQEGEWAGYSYLWNREQTEAELVESAGRDVEYEITTAAGVKKQTWRYPSRAECMVCHSRAANYVLGLTTLQMNKEHDHGGVKANQLRTLEHLGLLKVAYGAEARADLKEALQAKHGDEKKADEELARRTATRGQRPPPTTGLLAKNPERHAALVDPYDARQPLDARARSYLHANCSSCHVEAGGGNAQMELEFTTPADKTRLFDVKPVHAWNDPPDARLVAPGAPERSVLTRRVARRGPGQMPPLASNLVDQAGVELLEAWIRGMEAGAEAKRGKAAAESR